MGDSSLREQRVQVEPTIATVTTLSYQSPPPPYTPQDEQGGAGGSPSCYTKIFCCYTEGCKKRLRHIASHPLCPSWSLVSRCLAMSMLCLMIWGSAFSELGAMAGLEGQLFKIGVLGVAAHVGGYLIYSLLKLPSLLGMMLVGIALRNIDYIVISGSYLEVTAAIRHIALVIILIKAGLGLDPSALKKMGGILTRIIVVPALVEAVFVATLTRFLLDLPWMWGFLLGSVLAAVAPDITIPCLLYLEEKGNYGKSKGIPTLVIAASSFDDVLCISIFGVLLGVITSTGDLTMQIIQGPVGLVIGLVCGIILGMLLRYIPSKNDKRVTLFRTLLTAGAGILFVFGSIAIGYEGAGPLGSIVVAFVASMKWDPAGKELVDDNFGIMYEITKPILFGLIGIEINLKVLEGGAVSLGIICLLIALVARIAASIFVAYGGNLSWKEKIFVSAAWFPKATVQAALGPVALDRVQKLGLENLFPYANTILIISVLSILITAPIGAILITSLGPRLLEKGVSQGQNSHL